MIPSLFISGPTGSGKSTLALRLAVECGGEIINGDSVQLYRDHEIGSAMPSGEEQAVVPHHLFGVLPGDADFDVKQYVELARSTIDDVSSRGARPIVVGGSPLYLQALLEGLSLLPAADSELRAELEQEETEKLHDKLHQLDSERAEQLHQNDRVRVIRALEVCLLSGKRYSELCRGGEGGLPSSAMIVVPVWPREELYHRINTRAREMIQRGLLRETLGLLEQYGEHWRNVGALGYAQAVSAVQRSTGEEAFSPEEQEAVAGEIAQATRRYAKRQMTFWRNGPSKLGWRGKSRIPALEVGKGVIADHEMALTVGMGEILRGLSEVPNREPASQRFLREVWYVDARGLLGPDVLA
ncbi:tRNA (adenosine(37)-N6)-dimethylallyltransferase MiaA [bacterium]|nr:tRNA (adenosine(37)-N6)-dimethylallyltransferase MiaA [bacterium]